MTIDPLPALFSFALYGLIFTPLERLAAMHRRPLLRPGLGTDLLFLFGNFLLWSPLVVIALVAMADVVELLPLAGLRHVFARQPLAIQAVEALLISDCAIYWFHRACHRVPILWRFHSVHHTAEHVDWIAAYREHPLDNLATRAIENLPLLILGFPLTAIAGFVAFRGLWALFIHSNIDWSPGPLRFLLGSPRLHHWHHEPAVGTRRNFANLNPLMDLLFGTYADPGSNPQRYGAGTAERSGYLGLLLRPLGIGRRTAAVSTVRPAIGNPAAGPLTG